MRFGLTLLGYRNFNRPVTISFGDANVALVGPNNVGKSNVFRFLYEFRDVLTQALGTMGQQSQLQASLAGLKDQSEYFPRGSGQDFCVRVHFDEALSDEVGELIIRSSRQEPNQFRIAYRYRGDPETQADRQPQSCQFNEPSIKRLTRCAEILNRVRYFGGSRTSITAHGDGQHYDFVSGRALIANWHSWRAGSSIGQSDQAKRLTKLFQDTFSLPRVTIDANVDRSDIHFDGDNRMSLSEMGYGLSQFFSILMNVAMHRPSILLIDEPESNLHASLQMKFFSAINEFCDSIVFSTHSIGLARQVAERIYSFVPAEGGVEVRALADPKSIAMQLGELSYAAFAEIGYERILLVEGPSDLQCFQQALQTLGFGSKVVLISLGGDSGIAHASTEAQIAEFARLVAPRAPADCLAAIIDSEKDDSVSPLSKTRTNFVSLLQTKNIPCHVLHRRALENYFEAKHLDSPLTALGPFEKRNGWPKVKNLRFASRWTKEDLAATDIGSFLSQWLSN